MRERKRGRGAFFHDRSLGRPNGVELRRLATRWTDQSSMCRPGTRLKSRRFRDTTTAPFSIAIAAIRRSIRPPFNRRALSADTLAITNSVYGRMRHFANRKTESARFAYARGNLPGKTCSTRQCVPTRQLLIDGHHRNRQVRRRSSAHRADHDGVAAVIEREQVRIQDEEAHKASGSWSSSRRYSAIASRQG